MTRSMSSEAGWTQVTGKTSRGRLVDLTLAYFQVDFTLFKAFALVLFSCCHVLNDIGNSPTYSSRVNNSVRLSATFKLTWFFSLTFFSLNYSFCLFPHYVYDMTRLSATAKLTRNFFLKCPAFFCYLVATFTEWVDSRQLSSQLDSLSRNLPSFTSDCLVRDWT